MYLRNITTPVSSLKGVGKQLSQAYLNLGVQTCGDLLQLPPRAYEDRTKIIPLSTVKDGEFANTMVEVVSHSYFGHGKKRTLKVIIKDIADEGRGMKASLLCFNRNFLEKVLRIGRRYYLYGQISYSYRELQSSQFEMIPIHDTLEDVAAFGKLVPLYPLSGRLTHNSVRNHIREVLSTIPHIENELPESIIASHNLISTDDAVRMLHTPANMEQAETAKKTLAFTELFYLLLASSREKRPSVPVNFAPRAQQKEKELLDSFPFSLTEDQKSVLARIKQDLYQNHPMHRMLQGDVGSGKTLVAWVSALHVIFNGGQVAFMAPTELLARQHAEQAAKHLEPLGIRIAFFTGAVRQKARTYLLDALKMGDIDIAIGTHALFSQDVTFKNLRYIIIDEQHRFGVVQRMSLEEKGTDPHVLMMSATPIPRSLALTVFSDIDLSTIRSMPAGRIPIITYLVSNRSRERMYKSVGVEFERGHQAYFVYPRIDDSGESSLRDVETMYAFLSKEMYPDIPSALIHSRLSEQEKITILRDFREKKLTYIVSTSVVEVGLDIPDATVMVIEHAERFGLAALHQLRGRVGRSSLQSYCFLVYETPLAEDAQKRLKVLKESNDGFYIAEQDLLIRGPGDVVGTKQSGFLKLRFASLTNDIDLLASVKHEVDSIIANDKGLLSMKHERIRKLLAESPYFSTNSEM
ncbi:MAG: ATP-dependent DNA helicase RecG [Sphaerochaetaceae bacterium]